MENHVPLVRATGQRPISLLQREANPDSRLAENGQRRHSQSQGVVSLFCWWKEWGVEARRTRVLQERIHTKPGPSLHPPPPFTLASVAPVNSRRCWSNTEAGGAGGGKGCLCTFRMHKSHPGLARSHLGPPGSRLQGGRRRRQRRRESHRGRPEKRQTGSRDSSSSSSRGKPREGETRQMHH